jgi:peptide/nickel transport system permease protein
VALGRVAELARMTRSSMLEVLSKDYIRTARGKGLAERAVILRHGLKNAANLSISQFYSILNR